MEQHSALHRGPDSYDFRLSSSGSYLHSQFQIYGLLIKLSFKVAALGTIAFAATAIQAATIFESGTLGTTGVPWEEIRVRDGLGGNVGTESFVGVRFELTRPVITTHVGGHFVNGVGGEANFFAAVIALDNENDFPDSDDLSTPDVRGNTILVVQEHSNEFHGSLELSLTPGWYGLVVGGGLFGATGEGAVLLNNSDIGIPDYIGFLSGFGWGGRPPGQRFVVNGAIVPEPTSIALTCAASLFLLLNRSKQRF